MKEEIGILLRALPSMDELLLLEWVSPIEKRLGREAVKSVFADVIGETRKSLREGDVQEVDVEQIARIARSRLKKMLDRSLKRVVNATGVVVHTNLGRSRLADEALEAVMEVAGRYSNLEYDLSDGARGQRNAHIEWLLCQVSGADAGIVVNNNAGAVLLCLSALARGRQAIVSRGELVEIGGSFRIPDIMSFSGARMVEVGTTNRTHLKDYRGAICEETAILLKVHPSNYRVTGFHSMPERREIADLAREKDIIFMEDLGSGVLQDLAACGLSGEPTVKQCVLSGVDIVTFSGDKLLGGPQIGCVVGRKQLVDKLRTYPFLRALRIDKMTLAAFEATLRLYLEGKAKSIPTLEMISASATLLRARASSLARKIKCETVFSDVSAVKVTDAVGGGAFPTTQLEGYGVQIQSDIPGSRLLESLREAPVPVVAGIRDGNVVLHVRTLTADDRKAVIEAIRFVGRKFEKDV
ncbi:MAG: L-seryl-tRNA(Sec) selenium transferase [Synergistota bacterium]|nr:L-seryl-tRNA(Sec) selenium transferase [Synergistota bacterium]